MELPSLDITPKELAPILYDAVALEKECLKHDQADCPVIHRFSPGIYIREVHLSAGVIAVGHYQLTRHLNVFLKGRVTMFNDDGSQTELSAPMIFTGEPGRKKGYIHEDVVWLNVYPTEETNIETLEATYLEKSEVFADSILPVDRAVDREDHESVIKESGFSKEEVYSQVVNEEDQIVMPDGSYKFLISDSDIHGKGVFATANIEPEEIIGVARIDGKRTPLGRFTNHAKNSNAEMRIIGTDIYLVASDNINGCKGGLNGDEITVNYRHSLNIAKLIGDIKCQE